jgi:hypothetical protein
MAATPDTLAAAIEQNEVTDWAMIVQPAIHNASEPRPPVSSFVLHTIAQLAVYDAAMAIGGGYEPYHTATRAPKDADLRAAVGTAAYRAARGRVAQSQLAYLDDKYGAYMATIVDGPSKQHGIEVGEASAAGILALRADDGFNHTVTYQCSASPPPAGEFEPEGGCGTQPIDPKIAAVTPFTFSNPAQFRPDGPDPLTSDRWVTDFDEVKAYGRKDSTVRTPEQTDVVYFWSEHAYVHWNRNLVKLATGRGLNIADTARLFAMAYTAAADAAIAGFEAKYFYRSWRPRTSIPGAADDGNPKTTPDATWVPLLSVNHPEYPSGHAFESSAVTEAVATFFRTDQVVWTIETSKAAVPQLVQTQRTYPNLKAIVDEIDNARVWAGLHYRNSMIEGNALGTEVAKHVMKTHFRRRAAGPAAATTLPRTGSAWPTAPLAVLGLTLSGAGAATRALARRQGQSSGVVPCADRRGAR